MPIKVTLVSPRSRLSVKVSSTVSVNSEFEYLNLPGKKASGKPVKTMEIPIETETLIKENRAEVSPHDHDHVADTGVADPVLEGEVGNEDSNHQSRLTEKKSEKIGFLSSLDFTSKSKKKNSVKAPAPSRKSPPPSTTQIWSPNMSNTPQQSSPPPPPYQSNTTPPPPYQSSTKLTYLLPSSDSPFPFTSTTKSKSSGTPFASVVTSLVSSLSPSPRSSTSSKPSPSYVPFCGEEEMTSVRKMTELPPAATDNRMTPRRAELTPPVRAANLPAPERPPKGALVSSMHQNPPVSSANVINSRSRDASVDNSCNSNSSCNSSFLFESNISAFSDDSFWDNCETLRVSEKPTVDIISTNINEEITQILTPNTMLARNLSQHLLDNNKDYFSSSSQVRVTSEKITNKICKDYISRSNAATPISSLGSSCTRYGVEETESPRVVTKLSCQVGSYTSSGAGSSLHSRQEAEPQVAQPQRPPRNQPAHGALMPPPPAYYHQKPPTRSSFPPTITINPSYRSVDPSPIPSRSPSPVADSPSPPPPPEPLSLPPPMEAVSVGLRKAVNPRNRSHSPEPSFPPPPSNGTLKRMTSYKRSEKDLLGKVLNCSVQLPGRSDMYPGLHRDQSPGVHQDILQDQDSPSRNAAKGAAAGWQKFHGKNGGRSVSVSLTKEEAEMIRQRRRREAYRGENNMSTPPEITEAMFSTSENLSTHKLSYTSGFSCHNPTYLPSPNLKVDLQPSAPHNSSSNRVEELSRMFLNNNPSPTPSRLNSAPSPTPSRFSSAPSPTPTRLHSAPNLTPSRLMSAPVATSTPPPVKRSSWKEADLVSADRSRKPGTVYPARSAVSTPPMITTTPVTLDTSTVNNGNVGGDELSPPPLPPKPKQKISMIGSPNSDQFIVMDNSSYFASAVNTSSTTSANISGASSSTISPDGPLRSTQQNSPSTAVDQSLQQQQLHDSSPVQRLTEANLSSNLSLSSPSAVMATVLSTTTTQSHLHTPHHLPEPHSRSDSGLSSLGSWTAPSSGARSGTSSVRSSSIVSNSSTKLEELFHGSRISSSDSAGGKRSSSIVSSCSMKLEEFDELEEETDEGLDKSEDDSSDHLAGNSNQQTSIETGVQRQLATVKEQKERLIKEIVENEQVGMDIQARLEASLTGRDLEKYGVYLEEMEKVVLLLLSLSSRLERAEEELACGNLTDWEKEAIRRKRDKLSHQLEEAHVFKDMSIKRQHKVEDILQRELGDTVLYTFRGYIAKREELLRSQRACEEAERSILPSIAAA